MTSPWYHTLFHTIRLTLSAHQLALREGLREGFREYRNVLGYERYWQAQGEIHCHEDLPEKRARRKVPGPSEKIKEEEVS